MNGPPDLRFIVYGEPKPQGSKIRTKFSVRESGGEDLKLWREAVRSTAVDAQSIVKRGGVFVLEGPIDLQLEFTMRKPSGAPKRKRIWPVKRPDLDKLCRAVLDAMTNAGVWKDDSQVVALHAHKRYVGDPFSLDTPGVRVCVWKVEHD